MDYEVVPMPYKFYDWLLNLSRDHFSLHWGKNVKVAMGFEIPKMHFFKAYITHCHDPTGFVVGEAKEVHSLQILGDHGKEMPL